MNPITRKQRPLKLPADAETRVVAMYKSGLTCGDIAREFGVSRQSVRGYLSRRIEIRRNERTDNPFFRGGSFRDLRAEKQVQYAVKKGRLVRPASCERCGESPKNRRGQSLIHAHHCDYNKPLEVMWLCQPCHHDWHKNNVAIPRKEGA